jgi:PBP1b-binding outer membrane lipoprotein LpoB
MSEEEEKKGKGFVFVDKRKTHEEESKTDQKTEKPESKQKSAEQKTKETNAGEKTEKQPPLPEIDFNFFVLSLSSSAMMQMGVIPHPVTNKKEKNIDLAKQSIDIIAMLEDKTKGNLDKEEEQFLSSILYDLRMKFVEVSKEC